MTPIRNRSELEGRVVSLGALSRSSWGAPILPFVLEVARPGRGSDRIPCCAMDEYAEELAGCLTVGVLLHVEGALRWNAKRRTLGVCIRPPRGSAPPHGAWWMPEEDKVPLDDAERAAEIERCRRENDRITAAANGDEFPPEPPEGESVRDMAKRVMWEMYGDRWHEHWKELTGEEAYGNGKS